jgi:hypothetical protein
MKSFKKIRILRPGAPIYEWQLVWNHVDVNGLDIHARYPQFFEAFNTQAERCRILMCIITELGTGPASAFTVSGYSTVSPNRDMYRVTVNYEKLVRKETV